MAAPPTSTGFVSLQQYLAANKDAVGNTASGIAQDATAEGNDAKAADDKVAQEAQAGADAQAKQQGAYDSGRGQYFGSEKPQAYDYTQAPDYAAAQGQAVHAQKDIANLGTQGGLEASLAQKYGTKGTYTQGDDSLDASLLGADAGAQAQFKGVQGAFANLGSYLDNQAGGKTAAPVTQAAPAPKPPREDPITNPGTVKNNPRGDDSGDDSRRPRNSYGGL